MVAKSRNQGIGVLTFPLFSRSYKANNWSSVLPSSSHDTSTNLCIAISSGHGKWQSTILIDHAIQPRTGRPSRVQKSGKHLIVDHLIASRIALLHARLTGHLCPPVRMERQGRKLDTSSRTVSMLSGAVTTLRWMIESSWSPGRR